MSRHFRGYLSPSGGTIPVCPMNNHGTASYSLCSGKNVHGDRKIQFPWSWPEGSWGIVLDLWLEVCIENDELRFQQTTKACLDCLRLAMQNSQRMY